MPCERVKGSGEGTSDIAAWGSCVPGTVLREAAAWSLDVLGLLTAAPEPTGTSVGLWVPCRIWRRRPGVLAGSPVPPAAEKGAKTGSLRSGSLTWLRRVFAPRGV